MKPKKSKKFLKQAKKLVKKIRKHGKDGEKLLLEIKKLMESGVADVAKKDSKKKPAKAPAKKKPVVPKTDEPSEPGTETLP